MRDLTGAPSFDLSIKDKNLWTKIEEGIQKQYPMACSIALKDKKKIGLATKMGLINDHVYAILNAAEVKSANR